MTGFQVYDKVRIVGYPGVGVIVELNEPHYIVEFDGDPALAAEFEAEINSPKQLT